MNTRTSIHYGIQLLTRSKTTICIQNEKYVSHISRCCCTASLDVKNIHSHRLRWHIPIQWTQRMECSEYTEISSELWLKFIRVCYLRMGNQFSISQMDKQYLILLTLKLFAAICSNSCRQWLCKANTDTPDFERHKQQQSCHSTDIVTSTNKSIVSN